MNVRAARRIDIAQFFIGSFSIEILWQWFARPYAMEIPKSSDASEQVCDAIADVRDALEGDQEAYRKIVDRFTPVIARQMQRFSRDRRVQEELVHDVFVEAFVSLSSFRQASPLEHWLRKIAVRVGYRYWKDQGREKDRRELLVLHGLLDNDTSSDGSNASDAADELHFLLSKLAPRDRLVLTLLYWDECTVTEAAALSGWTTALVKVQAHRARKRLRKLLEERGYDDNI